MTSRPLRFGVFLTLMLALVLIPMVSVDAQSLIQRNFMIKQAGREIGTTTVEMIKDVEETSLRTVAVYPDLGLEIQTTYVFAGSEFPKKPVEYEFTVLAGGSLNLEMDWADTASYVLDLTGSTTDLGTANVLALDNNVISDYMVATWIYDMASAGVFEGNIIVPVLLPQGIGMLPMAVSYIGQETVGEYTTDHFRVNVGVDVDLWVDQSDRSLVKLHIPMQAFELVAQDLVDIEHEKPRVFTDFGNYSFTDQDFLTDGDRATISGTLTLPDLKGTLPGVVLVAGSGPTDRDGNSYVIPGPADYLKEIAHYLGSRGIAVLRFDKRGVGESPGEVRSFDDYINDISVLVDLIASLDNVDPERLFIVGHSEGAWLASEVARKRDDLRGIGLLAGAGYPFFDTVKRQLMEQSEAAVEAGLFDPDVNSRLEAALDEMYMCVAYGKSYDVSRYQLPKEFEQVILSFVYQKELLKDWLTADPAAVLSAVQVPVLIVQGSADTQVQVADAYALAAVLPENQYELHIFEGVDHVLKMTYGEPLPYTDPTRRVDQQLLQTIGDWILSR